MKPYDDKPNRLFTQLSFSSDEDIGKGSYCAGFECEEWRCDAYANHMMEWIADYALSEDELSVHHGNMYIRLREAAARIYTSEHYERRGEVGEITLHAICRDFFGTIPFASRVFYLTSSNDVVKSFDLVHVKYPKDAKPELWLGEAKFYKDRDDAISAAIESIKTHIDHDFLKNEKLILGPQVSKNVPRYQEIRDLLSEQTSLDELFNTAVFPICIAGNSDAIQKHTSVSDGYSEDVLQELQSLEKEVLGSGLQHKIKILLIYVPLASKEGLATAFDDRLKGVLG